MTWKVYTFLALAAIVGFLAGVALYRHAWALGVLLFVLEIAFAAYMRLAFNRALRDRNY